MFWVILVMSLIHVFLPQSCLGVGAAPMIYVVTLRFFMFGFSVSSRDKTVVKVWIRLGPKTTWCQCLVKKYWILLPLTQLECAGFRVENT